MLSIVALAALGVSQHRSAEQVSLSQLLFQEESNREIQAARQMNFKEFGPTGRKVSEVGMGTYYDPLWIATATPGWRRDASQKVEAIKAGLDAGMTLIDTAEIYGS